MARSAESRPLRLITSSESTSRSLALPRKARSIAWRAGLLLDQRAGQELLELRVAVEVRDEPVQLLEQLFGLPALLGDVRIASAYRRPISLSCSSTFGHG